MNNPNEKLPKEGERVLTLVLKEMIYQGNHYENGSEWKDDGEGFRAIVSWDDLSFLNEMYELKNDPAILPFINPRSNRNAS